ncbi:YSIRK-type signal peptide-containing protein [Staphylococcus rostri]|uniref:YSIRK-type signal peptide-containing protein n=1 Tax=Staphylococcus rostri TaxID=522262 RepID=UPI001980D074|nr:YSIRK-type signal peptide-containing protein [Staphylococcus rostri]
MKRKLDFLPNRNNRYSIRKFTVGTASILIGATLVFGVANDDAQAEEKDAVEETVSASDDLDVPDEENETTEVLTDDLADNTQQNAEEVSITETANVTEENKDADGKENVESAVTNEDTTPDSNELEKQQVRKTEPSNETTPDTNTLENNSATVERVDRTPINETTPTETSTPTDTTNRANIYFRK